MKTTIMRYFTFLLTAITALSVVSCAGSPLRTSWEAEHNRDNMLKLTIGQTRDQVMANMGRPYKTESYQIDGKIVEFWLYLTEGKSVYGSLGDSNFTPLAFENGVLTGWGRNYYDRVLRIKQDININR